VLDAVLLPFQREGLAFGIKHNGRVLIADEMGLGKTLQALALAWHYRGDWPLLIIAPSSITGAWIDELEKYYTSLEPTQIAYIRSAADVAQLDKPITLVSYALLNQKTLLQHMQQRRYGMVILDESHYIKNSKAKRTEAVLSLLAQASRLLLLSGTPALSRPEELFTQLDALCPGAFGSWSAYAKRYCNAHQGYFGWDTKGASNLPELNTKLQTVMIRRLKRDVLNQLPPKRRQRVTIDIEESAVSRVVVF